MSASNAALWERAFDMLAEALEARGERGWIVGGCLRDALLDRPVHDVDVALTCDPLNVAQRLPRASAVALAQLNRDTVRLFLRVDPDEDPLQVDLSPLHPLPPAGTLNSRLAAPSTSSATLEADLARRDFRVNAMALPLTDYRDLVALLPAGSSSPASGALLPAPDNLIDPMDGYADLQHRTLNTASSHALSDDPGRIVRAARLVASHSFAIAPTLIRHAQTAAHRLTLVPGDRLREEMSLLLALPRAAAGVAALAEMNALSILLPGLSAPEKIAHALASLGAVACLQKGDAPEAAMAPLASLDELRAWYATPLRPDMPRIAALRWALLAHAAAPHAGGPGAESLATVMSSTSSNQPLAAMLRVPLAGVEQAIVVAAWTCATWRARLAEGMPSDAELRHLFAAQHSAAVDTLAAAAACNAALAANPLPGARYSPHVPERVRAILDLYFTDRERLEPPPLLTGADLIPELGMPSGPALGNMLRRIRDAQLDGAVATRTAALALARELLREADAEQT